MQIDDRRMKHTEGRGVSLPCLHWSRPPAERICISVQRGVLVSATTFFQAENSIKNRQVVCEQHGRNVHQTVIWVTSDTFPQLPAAARPQSCRVLSLLADLSLCLKIDAHLQQQHGSSSARKRVNQESCGGIKSSAACFAKQRRPAYGCLVLPPQPRWEMVFVRVIKLSHNPITSVIFMIQPRDWTQSLCLTRQLDKC